MSDDPQVGVYPGSFDPVTYGHDDLIRRSLKIVDRIVVGVAEVSTEEKEGMFGVPERVEILREVYGDLSRVEVVSFSGLLVEFARQQDASLIIRGLRAVSDFEYEFQMALMNRSLWPDVEVIFMAPSNEYTFISSTLVREVASLGGDVSDFVPGPALRRLEERYGPGVRGQ